MTTYSIRKSPMNGKLHNYGSLYLLRVDNTKWKLTWNKMMVRWHYLASTNVVGSFVKYFIVQTNGSWVQLVSAQPHISWVQEINLLVRRVQPARNTYPELPRTIVSLFKGFKDY